MAQTTLNLGRIRPVNQGAWSASTAYVYYDHVSYNGGSYICTASGGSPAGTIPSSSDKWALVAQGSQGVPGPTPNIAVTANTLPAGSSATATRSGTDTNPLITFGIPKGDTGATGPQGETGAAGPQGPAGADGASGTVSVDTHVISQQAVEPQSFSLDPFATLLVYVDGVLATQNETYTVSGTTVTFTSVLPIGVEVKFVRFSTLGIGVLPAATASTLGAIKVGSRLAVDANGVLSADYGLASDAQIDAIPV